MKKENLKNKIISVEIIPTTSCEVVDKIVADIVEIGIRKVDYRYMRYSLLLVEVPESITLPKLQKSMKKANKNIKSISVIEEGWNFNFRDFSSHIPKSGLIDTYLIMKYSRQYMYSDQNLLKRI